MDLFKLTKKKLWLFILTMPSFERNLMTSPLMKMILSELRHEFIFNFSEKGFLYKIIYFEVSTNYPTCLLPISYRDPVISLVLHLGVKNLFHYTSRRMMNVFTLQWPTYSHKVGLQNKFCFHVHRLTSGLFYENSTR